MAKFKVHISNPPIDSCIEIIDATGMIVPEPGDQALVFYGEDGCPVALVPIARVVSVRKLEGA